MNNLNLRNSIFATLVLSAAYAPVSSAIIKHQSISDRLESATRSVTVDFSDLDVTGDAGATALYQRLRNAAKAVCGNRDMRNLSDSQAWRNCYREALDGAIEKVGVERLTKLRQG